MRNIFRSSSMVLLMEDIRAYHKWVWVEGESRAKRVTAEFNVTTDHRRNQYVATRKS